MQTKMGLTQRQGRGGPSAWLGKTALKVAGIVFAEINSNFFNPAIFTAIIAKNKKVRPVIFGLQTVTQSAERPKPGLLRWGLV